VENSKLKIEMDQLKDIFSKTTTQMGAEITTLRLLNDEIRQNDDVGRQLVSTEEENVNLNDRLKD